MSLFGAVADSYVAAGGGGGSPTRLYFASSGTASASPTPNAAWDVTTSAPVRPLLTSAQLGSGSSAAAGALSETSASAVNRLLRQHVSTTTIATAKTISGSFSFMAGFSETNTDMDAFLQLIIYVTSGDGSTVRGVLYSGQSQSSASATSTDPNYEFGTGNTYNSRILSGVAMSSVSASSGDRIVVEVGYRATNATTSSRSASMYIDDRSASTDTTLAVDQAMNGHNWRPWIEFDSDIFA